MAKSAAGTTISIAGAITEVVDISGPDMAADQIDVTCHGSTSLWKEFLNGLKDGGQVTVECNFVKATMTSMISLIGSATPSAISIVLAGSLGTFAFNANVQGLRVNAPVSGKSSLTISLKVTGAVGFS
jgi:predicted secreted protein